MSADVLPFRQARVIGTQDRKDLSRESRFFCQRCQSDRFKILTDGSVYCAGAACWSRISNLTVAK